MEDVTVTHGNLTPKEVWDTRAVWQAKLEEDKARWESLTDKERATVLTSTAIGIEKLADRIEDWLPEAVTAKTGNYVDVTFRIMYTDAH